MQEKKFLGVPDGHILSAIAELTEELGMPPTQREVARRVYLSDSSMCTRIRLLESEGKVRRGRGWRTLQLTEEGRRWM